MVQVAHGVGAGAGAGGGTVEKYRVNRVTSSVLAA
jgi:hypothetical protein